MNLFILVIRVTVCGLFLSLVAVLSQDLSAGSVNTNTTNIIEYPNHSPWLPLVVYPLVFEGCRILYPQEPSVNTCPIMAAQVTGFGILLANYRSPETELLWKNTMTWGGLSFVALIHYYSNKETVLYSMERALMLGISIRYLDIVKDLIDTQWGYQADGPKGEIYLRNEDITNSIATGLIVASPIFFYPDAGFLSQLSVAAIATSLTEIISAYRRNYEYEIVDTAKATLTIIGMTCVISKYAGLHTAESRALTAVRSGTLLAGKTGIFILMNKLEVAGVEAVILAAAGIMNEAAIKGNADLDSILDEGAMLAVFPVAAAPVIGAMFVTFCGSIARNFFMVWMGTLDGQFHNNKNVLNNIPARFARDFTVMTLTAYATESASRLVNGETLTNSIQSTFSDMASTASFLHLTAGAFVWTCMHRTLRLGSLLINSY